MDFDDDMMSHASDSSFHSQLGQTPGWEEHLILRVTDTPEGREVAQQINTILEKGLYKNMSLMFLDTRHAELTVNGVPYAATLLDLPCILETHRSKDGTNLMKSNDVGQMLLVDVPEEQTTKKQKRVYNNDFQMFSGITPPNKEILKRWKRQRKQNGHFANAELEVLKMMRSNEEGEIFDLVDADEVDNIDKRAQKRKSKKKKKKAIDRALMEDFEADLFGKSNGQEGDSNAMDVDNELEPLVSHKAFSPLTDAEVDMLGEDKQKYLDLVQELEDAKTDLDDAQQKMNDPIRTANPIIRKRTEQVIEIVQKRVVELESELNQLISNR